MNIGHKLDNRYELLEKIGGGGMAAVYKAKDLVLDRFVAVKVMNNSLLHDQEFVNRFVFEARATAKLSHPNVVKVFDAGVDHQIYYMVMELVEGHTLKQYISKYAPLEEEETIRIIRHICFGLAHAHQNGIIHRDIKPQNIIYSTDGTYKVADFGISRVLQETNSFTKTGNVVGSVHYMSPEQITEQPISFATDLYSLGIVLFEMLTGHPPYDSKEMVAIALQHLNDPIPDPKKYNPTLSDELVEIIYTLLDKDPSNRFQSIGELLDTLENILGESNSSSSLFKSQNSGSTQYAQAKHNYSQKGIGVKTKKHKSRFKPIFWGTIVSIVMIGIGYQYLTIGRTEVKKDEINQAQQTHQSQESNNESTSTNQKIKGEPRWKIEEPKYFINDIFRKHSVVGSNGNYTVKITISRKIPNSAIYYNVYSVRRTDSERIITRKKVPIQLDPKKPSTEIEFQVNIPGKHIPDEGILKIEIFWLNNSNDYRRERIENLLEKF